MVRTSKIALPDPDLLAEDRAVYEALINYESLNFTGGAILIEFKGGSIHSRRTTQFRYGGGLPHRKSQSRNSRVICRDQSFIL